MARISDEVLETIEKKAGFIKVCHKHRYEEEWIAINDLVAGYRELVQELKERADSK